MADRATLRAATDREQLETLARVARGETLDSIARDQWLTQSAIGMRLQRFYRKLGARSAAHAVAIAHERGLLPIPATTDDGDLDTRARLAVLEVMAWDDDRDHPGTEDGVPPAACWTLAGELVAAIRRVMTPSDHTTTEEPDRG